MRPAAQQQTYMPLTGSQNVELRPSFVPFASIWSPNLENTELILSGPARRSCLDQRRARTFGRSEVLEWVGIAGQCRPQSRDIELGGDKITLQMFELGGVHGWVELDQNVGGLDGLPRCGRHDVDASQASPDHGRKEQRNYTAERAAGGPIEICHACSLSGRNVDGRDVTEVHVVRVRS